MKDILINPDPWKCFSEDLEARRGMLLRPEEVWERIGDVIGDIR
jgi:hypothetical protein